MYCVETLPGNFFLPGKDKGPCSSTDGHGYKSVGPGRYKQVLGSRVWEARGGICGSHIYELWTAITEPPNRNSSRGFGLLSRCWMPFVSCVNPQHRWEERWPKAPWRSRIHRADRLCTILGVEVKKKHTWQQATSCASGLNSTYSHSRSLSLVHIIYSAARTHKTKRTGTEPPCGKHACQVSQSATLPTGLP